jgi:hypothetical protein
VFPMGHKRRFRTERIRASVGPGPCTRYLPTDSKFQRPAACRRTRPVVGVLAAEHSFRVHASRCLLGVLDFSECLHIKYSELIVIASMN